MSIHRLLGILPPPFSPKEVPLLENWRRADAEYGPLPSDYHTFINTYGTGVIDNFLWISNPASENPNLNFARQASTLLDALRTLNTQFPRSALLLQPAPGGLLPFGVTDNGDILLWETRGNPDSWTIAVLPSREANPIRLTTGLTDFLVGVLEKTVRCDAFPDDFPSTNPRFVQHSEET